jgi:hypothetical protein
MEGMTVAALTISALAVGYATRWLVRHERAVRRFRADFESSGNDDRR